MRVGIIGLGFGATVHLPALRMLPNVQVVALGARRADKARELAARSGIEVGGTLEDVLGADLDAVTLALPPDVGDTVAEQALRRGLAVLAEKPIATSVARARNLVQMAKNRTAAVGFELAELDCFRELKRQVEQAGSVQSVRASWHTRSYAQVHRKWSWKTDRAHHGGAMNLLGSHLLFLVEWLIGPIESLSARFSSERTQLFAPPGGQAAEDRAFVSARGPGGVPVEIEVDNASGGAGQKWELVLPRSRLLIEEASGGVLVLTDGRGELASDRPAPGLDWRIEPFRRLAARFIECAERKVACSPGFDSGARVQQLLETAARSVANDGQTVRVAA
jgi:predicted dehydrogenase